MSFLTRLVLSFLLAASAAAVGAAPPDRYTAEVPVTGADAAQRDEAIGRALREVVVKVSGDPRSVSRTRAVRDPTELVAQYQYAAGPGGARVLRVTFDREAVDGLLAEAPPAPASAATPAAAPVSAPAVPGERFRVQVRGLDSLAKHVRVTRTFQGAAGLDAVALRAARGDVALFEISGRASAEQLDRAALDGGLLQPDPAPPAGAGGAAAGQTSFDGARLRYRVTQ
jgi:hypothetical protein